MSNNSILSSIKWIFSVSVIQKVISFSLTQVLLRIASPALLGRAAIQLELFLSTLLFLSREGIRLALLRENKSDNTFKRQQFINLSWFPAFLVSAVTIALLWRKLNSNAQDVDILLSYCIGALFEAIGEPWVNMNLQRADLRPKLAAETFAVLVKSLTTIISISVFHLDIYSFGIAQMTYGLAYLTFLVYYSKLGILWPQIESVNVFASVDGNAMNFAAISSISAFLKHILTESDKLALSVLSSDYSQGIFAVASNYGSLAARLLFLPLEDTARITFSKLALTANEDEESVLQMHEMLLIMLRVVLFIGSVFVIFGIAYCELVVDVIFSSAWRNDEMVRTLQAYCVYLFMLGLNGVTEAFVQSVASTDNFWFINVGFIVSSGVFACGCFLLVGSLGTGGVVIAGALSMSTRISFSWYIISTYWSKFKRAVIALDLLPPRRVVLAGLVSVIIVAYSSQKYHYDRQKALLILSFDTLQHVVYGAIAIVAYASVTASCLSHASWQRFLKDFRGKVE